MTYEGFPFWKHDFDEWWYRMFAAYLRSTLVPTHVSLPLIFRKPGGLIVNTLWRNRGRYLCDPFFDPASSAVGRKAYGLDLELRGKGVTVVGLSPGWTCTEPMDLFRRESSTSSPLRSTSVEPSSTWRWILVSAKGPARSSK